MSTKLFIGNLTFTTTRDELERLFAEAGKVVEVFLPTDRATGRPRGFAFVEYADGPTATAAITRFDGYELNGRNLRVNEAQERTARPARNFFDSAPPMDLPPKRLKAKGSRRNLRARKRSL